MRFSACLLALVCLATCATPPITADLTKVPRTTSREPAYRGKPRYMLLVFGPAAKFRVWLVFDGDIVYVDRNGNGDLTERGERLEPSEKPTETRFIRCTEYDVGTIEDPFTGKKYDKLRITRLTLKPDYVPKTKEEKERIEALGANGTLARIQVWRAGNIEQVGSLSCAGSPAKASILHLDGPLTLRLVDEVVLKRGGEPAELAVELGTPGLGRQVYHYVSFDIAPKDVHPVAEIEFPSNKPDGRPIRARYPLKGRC